MPEAGHALELLRRALAAQIAGDVEGPTFLAVVGTVNIIGAGSGGTSQIDNSSFTPGGSSITPIGGYFGGRTISSGRTAAPAIDGSAILQVNVVAGGAGGGNANLTTRGTANNDLHVGFASGAAGADGNALLPVIYASGFYPTVNVGAGTETVNIANIPTVNLGQGIVGSVNIAGSAGFVGLGGSVGVAQITNPWVVVGSVNVTPVATGTVSLGAPLTVAGTANTSFHVGYASGAAGNDGNYALPVLYASGFYPTVNVGAGAGFGSVGVYGSVMVGGSLGVAGIGGSIGVTQITSPWVVTGSVNITGSINPITGSVNITGSLNPVGVFGSVSGIVTVNIGAIPTVWIGGIGTDTTNSALRVNVVAGGAGGGVANLTVRGSANTDLHVGYASGAGVNVDGGAFMPVQFGTGYFPTVNVVPIGVDTTNSALRVNVVAGGAGGGVANLEVQGTANTAIHVGFASGAAGPYADGGAALPVIYASGFYPTVNLGANAGVTQVTSPWVVTGSVNITGSINPVALGSVGVYGSVAVYGSAAMVNLGGSTGVTQITSPWVVTGSVNITGSINPITGSVNITGSINPVGVFGSVQVVGSVNVTAVNTQTVWLTNVGVVDTSASIVPTIWPFNIAASGYNTLMVGPSGAPGPRIMLYDFTLITDATVGVNIQSPSGTYLTGSLMQLLPGAGWAKSNNIHNPVLMCGSGNAATVFMYLTATAHVAGWAMGYCGTGN